MCLCKNSAHIGIIDTDSHNQFWCQETSITHKTITAGPTNPIKEPPIRKSFCSIIPVLYAIALGGVETGRNNAVEADNPMIMATSMLYCGKIAIPKGISTVAVAVLLIMLENNMVA